MDFLFHINASMSDGVMSHLEELAPRVEQCSIDKTFLDIRDMDICIDVEDFRRHLREPVSSGKVSSKGIRPTPARL